MKKPVNGHGTLQRNGAISELTVMSTDAYAVEERGAHRVRLVMTATSAGGCRADVSLSAEDAAQLASIIYALARTAIIKNDRETMKEGMAHVAQVAA